MADPTANSPTTTQLDRDLDRELDRVLGRTAIESLRRRGLIQRIDVPTGDALSEDRIDRTLGAIIGLAAGDALGRSAQRRQARFPRPRNELADELRTMPFTGDRRGAGTAAQTFELSIEAWLTHQWAAPRELAHELDQRLDALRSRGGAIAASVAALRSGSTWFESAPSSCGSAALARAAAVGLVHAPTPEHLGEAASIDTAVSHASRRATASGAAMAAIVAGLVNRSEKTSPRQVIEAVVTSIQHDSVRVLLATALTDAFDPGVASSQFGSAPLAPNALALAVWCALYGNDPAHAIATAAAMRGDAPTVAALTGALIGAIHGASSLPPDWASAVDDVGTVRFLAERIVGRPPTPVLRVDAEERRRESAGADIWFLLDRSGSMRPIARDVVHGFETFFDEQRAVVGDATVTVVQFDDREPHDVIVDAQPMSRVRSIADRFAPRGMTPLYDAIGLLLDRAEQQGGDPDDQLVVVFTDGHENASHRWSQRRLFSRIERLRDLGWTFVFLGANQDSYATGSSLGMRAGNLSNFQANSASVAAMHAGLNRTVAGWRSKDRIARRRDRDDFWGGQKEAELTDLSTS